ncbi:MAG: FAD-dependent oxidoreductase [Hydrogenophaga sp.]|nr:FAD-dependent oxidoreductase [Hydrogenophaga sp.]
MKIAVVGAGVVGITTAYELTLDGHEVTVFDRRHTAAEEASFANGSVITPGWSTARIGAERAWRTLFGGPGSALQLDRLPRGAQWRWLWQWHQCGRPGARAGLQRQMLGLMAYSQERQGDLGATLNLDHDRCQGLLLLWRTAQDLERAQPTMDLMREMGLTARTLSGDDARQLEPALQGGTPLHSATELEGESAANCREFALLLRGEAQRLGCHFMFGSTVERMTPVDGPGRAVTVHHRQADAATASTFDAVAICAGMASVGLLRPLGLRLPLQAVYGHSISAPVREPVDAPVAAVVDTRHHVSIVRLGQRVRVAGGARLDGPGAGRSPEALKQLYRVLADWYPGAAQLGGRHGQVQEWHGVQASLPDGPPLIGASRVPGIWLNLGHGAHGWSMACGSARALADGMAGRAPEVDLAGCAPGRFGL